MKSRGREDKGEEREGGQKGGREGEINPPIMHI